MPAPRLYRISQSGARWMVSAYLGNGKRLRRRFANEAPAREFFRELKQRVALEGAEGFRFTAEHRAAYVAALHRLRAVGANLDEAVSYYLDNHQHGPAVPFGEAVEALLSAKRAGQPPPPHD